MSELPISVDLNKRIETPSPNLIVDLNKAVFEADETCSQSELSGSTNFATNENIPIDYKSDSPSAQQQTSKEISEDPSDICSFISLEDKACQSEKTSDLTALSEDEKVSVSEGPEDETHIKEFPTDQDVVLLSCGNQKVSEDISLSDTLVDESFLHENTPSKEKTNRVLESYIGSLNVDCTETNTQQEVPQGTDPYFYPSSIAAEADGQRAPWPAPTAPRKSGQLVRHPVGKDGKPLVLAPLLTNYTPNTQVRGGYQDGLSSSSSSSESSPSLKNPLSSITNPTGTINQPNEGNKGDEKISQERVWEIINSIANASAFDSPFNNVRIPSHLAMTNVCITMSGIMTKKEKEKLVHRIAEMNGKTESTYTGATTHIVATSALTEKVVTARKNCIPVMTCEWVNAVWDACQFNPYIHACQDQFKDNKYACPLFLNVHFSISPEISKDDRFILEQLIIKNGGGILKEVSSQADMLICRNPAERCYQVANQLGIPIVSSSWVTVCVLDNAIVDYSGYEVKMRFDEISLQSQVIPPAENASSVSMYASTLDADSSASSSSNSTQ